MLRRDLPQAVAAVKHARAETSVGTRNARQHMYLSVLHAAKRYLDVGVTCENTALSNRPYVNGGILGVVI